MTSKLECVCVCVFLSVSFDILKKAFRALVKSERIPRRWCAEMDVGKDESHLKLLQTPEPHPRRARAPGNDRPAEVVGVGDTLFSSLID